MLDDVDIVIDAMNTLLGRRGLPRLDREAYRRIFTFPVKSYYARLGFDFEREPFEQLAAEYIHEFTSDKYRFSLHGDAGFVLDRIHSLGIGQSILSASREQELADSIKKLGIAHYFSKVAGLTDHYANSKVDRGKALLSDLNLDPREILLIGDTLHDHEVSHEIGCDCLIVANGHQSLHLLEGLPSALVGSLKDVAGWIEPLLSEHACSRQGKASKM